MFDVTTRELSHRDFFCDTRGRGPSLQQLQPSKGNGP
jgi:hypothetical protein